MKILKIFKRFTLELFIGIFVITNIIPIGSLSAATRSPQIVYPLKKVSKLECRYTHFDELSSKCIQNLPKLKTKDYTKYIKQNGGYNDYTRYYTVLWGASYKYGWDAGFGGHQGTDIASSKGTPVYSIADGKVIVAKKALGWGNVVTVEHYLYGKKVFSNYAHLEKIKVKVGDKVKAGNNIATVGNTGNSTGNHLHLQIDLDTAFHPYFYSKETCPYSYSKISESSVCFDDLKTNTIDPLLFFETNGKILNDLKTPTKKVNKRVNTNYTSNINTSIFDKTVYIGYLKSDIREVQEILRDLNLYNGTLNGNYKNIENIIYKYQISKKIVQNKSTPGAGWFGPKTRYALKKDYNIFLKSDGNKVYINKDELDNGIKTQKIDRKHIMTREEIEAREYETFIKSNEFDLDLRNVGGNIKLGTTSKIDFKITKKYRDKPFKGNTPLDISIITDERILKVFPKKFYNFSNGEREIKLSGIKSGVTNVQIKFGSKTIKTYKIRVYGENEKIYLESGVIYGNSSVVLADNVKGIALFKDKTDKRLVNIKYEGTYKLKGVGDTKVCIKKGTLKNLSNVYKRSCNSYEYKNDIEFTYDDTISGILLFDYKSNGSNAKIEIVNAYDNTKLVDKKLRVSNPKGLNNSYVYKNDVITALKNDIVTNSSKGYFLENRAITQYDSNLWVKKSLNKLKSDTYDSILINKVNDKLTSLVREPNSKNKTITRKTFLEKSYKYLVLNNINDGNIKDYKDLDNNLNNKAYSLFGDNLTWKDKFGDNYFQPNKQITRGEVAFMLNKTIANNTNLHLTAR